MTEFLHFIEPGLVYLWLVYLVQMQTLSFAPQLTKMRFMTHIFFFFNFILGWVSPVLLSWLWFKVPVEVFGLPALSFEQSCITLILIRFLHVYSVTQRAENDQNMVDQWNNIVNTLFPPKVKK